MDLIMLDTAGYLPYYERYKLNKQLYLKPPQRIFYVTDFAGYNGKHVINDSTPRLIRLNTDSFGGSGRRKFTIAKWNNDGQPDILVNSLNVTVLKNKGIKTGWCNLLTRLLLQNKYLPGTIPVQQLWIGIKTVFRIY